MAVSETLPTLMSDLAAVVAHLREITVELQMAGRVVGSGVIWRASGLVVTSAHVVARARHRHADHEVVLNNRRRLSATLIDWDRQLDLALLRVEASGLPAATMGDSDRLRPGELILAA